MAFTPKVKPPKPPKPAKLPKYVVATIAPETLDAHYVGDDRVEAREAAAAAPGSVVLHVSKAPGFNAPKVK